MTAIDQSNQIELTTKSNEGELQWRAHLHQIRNGSESKWDHDIVLVRDTDENPSADYIVTPGKSDCHNLFKTLCIIEMVHDDLAENGN